MRSVSESSIATGSVCALGLNMLVPKAPETPEDAIATAMEATTVSTETE